MFNGEWLRFGAGTGEEELWWIATDFSAPRLAPRNHAELKAQALYDGARTWGTGSASLGRLLQFSNDLVVVFNTSRPSSALKRYNVLRIYSHPPLRMRRRAEHGKCDA